MLNVILADDEEKICTLIEKSIHWEELNLHLSCICSNGVDLYEQIKHTNPDIVITDINMPGMNAIDLIRRLRSEGNQVRVLIISGYRQFEYAQEALRYNVDNYLLKPIDETELNHALGKVCRELQAERNAIHADAAEQIRETLQDYLLQDILRGNINGEKNVTLEEANSRYYLHLRPGCFRAVYVKIDLNGEDISKLNIAAVLNKVSEKCVRVLEHFHYDTLIAFEKFSLIFGINYSPEKENALKSLCKDILQLATEAVSLFGGLMVSVGVGTPYSTLDGLRQSYAEARDAVKYRLVHGTRHVFYADMRADQQQTVKIGQEERNMLLSALERGNTEILQKLFANTMLHKSDDVLVLYRTLEDIVIQYGEISAAYAEDLPGTVFAEKEVLQEMENASSLAALRSVVETQIRESIRLIAAERKKSGSKPIRDAKEYVKQHYMEKIRLEDVASHVALNPSYFSAMFSKEEGKTFTDYVNEYRINVAKDLLRSGKYTIAEICEMVGIGNQRYFGKVFRNQIGIKPNEYKKLYN